jgi:hypothetical protein
MERSYLTILFRLAPFCLVRNYGHLARPIALGYNPQPEGENTMANFAGIVKELGKERDRLHKQLSGLNAALEAFAGVYRGNNGIKPRRKMSTGGAKLVVVNASSGPSGLQNHPT